MAKEKTKLLIPLMVIALAGVLLVAGYFLFFDKGGNAGSTSEVLSSAEAGQKALDFINKNILEPQGRTASLVSVDDEGSIYKIKIKIDDQEYDSYISRDGKYLFPEGYEMASVQGEGEGQAAAATEVTPRARPDVKLFVMSYCPYGLQAEKMFLPVYNLLSAQADMGVYFVDYIMHGEKEIAENLNQYCIQQDENDRYADYLTCFVQDGDSEKCFQQAGIDKSEIDSCVQATDQQYSIYSQFADQNTWLSGSYPLFDVQKDLNEKYGVGGSPTLVINDAVVNLPSRSPESFKEAVCNAFESPPSACSQTLSDTAFSAGFGMDESTSGGSGSCE